MIILYIDKMRSKQYQTVRTVLKSIKIIRRKRGRCP